MVNLNTNTTDQIKMLNENNHISCLTSECPKMNFDLINKNYNISPNNLSYANNNTNTFTVLHQNMRGITNKIEEFLISLPSNAPQVICLTEHHLRTEEIGNVNFGQYTLGSAFCRQTFKQVGCVYLYF
jgi:hypothetical protein